MKEELINDILQRMLSSLDNMQMRHLEQVLKQSFLYYDVIDTEKNVEKDDTDDIVERFISAKRIEGCSEKTLKYYQTTIDAHNISYQRYKEIKKLYETILVEIDECLEYLNANDYVESSETSQSYNEMLANALSNFEEARKNMSVISDFYNQYRANYSPVISSAVERLSEFKRNVVFSGQAINEALKSEEWKNFCGLLDSLRND